jgi:hypothetical protein
MNADGELRVIYAIEEPRRVGFLGTVGDSVVSGEESFVDGRTTTKYGSRCAPSTVPSPRSTASFRHW